MILLPWCTFFTLHKEFHYWLSYYTRVNSPLFILIISSLFYGICRHSMEPQGEPWLLSQTLHLIHREILLALYLYIHYLLHMTFSATSVLSVYLTWMSVMGTEPSYLLSLLSLQSVKDWIKKVRKLGTYKNFENSVIELIFNFIVIEMQDRLKQQITKISLQH